MTIERAIDFDAHLRAENRPIGRSRRLERRQRDSLALAGVSAHGFELTIGFTASI
jgi:hypothetical protein